MALLKPQIRSGINKDNTELVAEPMWSDGDRVRFRLGRPEKIGGWIDHATGTATNIEIEGKGRGCFAWSDNSANKHYAIGTSKRLYILKGDGPSGLLNITPLRASGDLASGPFETFNASASVIVTDINHGLVSGDKVLFSGTASVGGVLMNGEFDVNSVSGNNYFVTASSTATVSTTGGGATGVFEYEISAGIDDSTVFFGFGLGGYSSGGFGESSATTGQGVVRDARIWFMDQWGEDLIAAPRGGSIYRWDTSKGIASDLSRATEITNAPGIVEGGILVSQPDRHLIALGANSLSSEDIPLTISWCDQDS